MNNSTRRSLLIGAGLLCAIICLSVGKQQYRALSEGEDDDDDINTAICKPGGKGILLPLFGEREQRLPKAFRGIVYFFLLMYMFLGVGLLCDVFMEAIEVITSQEKSVLGMDGKKRRVKVLCNHDRIMMEAPKICLDLESNCGEPVIDGLRFVSARNSSRNH